MRKVLRSRRLPAPLPRKAPPDAGIEIALAGRSNAGKSSALNVITGQRALARISKAPGRTREINFFAIDGTHRLVDLPGYGYAKVSRETRQRWEQGLSRYLETRRSLTGLVLLMDCRHPLRDSDRQILRWARAADLPVHVVLTKSDKLARGPARATLLDVRRRLPAEHPQASVQLFSALKRDGLEELHAVLDRWFGFGEGP